MILVTDMYGLELSGKIQDRYVGHKVFKEYREYKAYKVTLVPKVYRESKEYKDYKGM